MQALELARQKNDSIKDEIWHELAQVQFKRWEQDSAAQLEQQDALEHRIHQALQRQHQQELAEVRQCKPPSKCTSKHAATL